MWGRGIKAMLFWVNGFWTYHFGWLLTVTLIVTLLQQPTWWHTCLKWVCATFGKPSYTKCEYQPVPFTFQYIVKAETECVAYWSLHEQLLYMHLCQLIGCSHFWVYSGADLYEGPISDEPHCTWRIHFWWTTLMLQCSIGLRTMPWCRLSSLFKNLSKNRDYSFRWCLQRESRWLMNLRPMIFVLQGTWKLEKKKKTNCNSSQVYTVQKKVLDWIL